MLHQSGVNRDLGGGQGGGGNEVERLVSLVVQKWLDFTAQARDRKGLPNEFPRQPEEWFFEVVVRLRRDFEVLNVLLSVESYGTGLHFSLLR